MPKAVLGTRVGGGNSPWYLESSLVGMFFPEHDTATEPR